MSSPYPAPGAVPVSAPPPGAPRPGSGLPLPPATVVAAAALTALGIVSLVVATEVADLGDLFAPLEWRAADERMLVTTLSIATGAGLVGGAIAALFRRGGGLLRVAGAALAVLALAVLVVELAQDADVTRTVTSAVVAVVGVAIAVLGGLAPSRRWYEAGERAAAEQAIARALAPGATRGRHIAGRGIGWALAAAVCGAVVVGAAGLVVAELAPPVVGESQDWSLVGGIVVSDEVEEIPVDRSDYDWDPQLDRLAQSCAEGSFRDCDDLYWESDVDTDYEDYGSTCGGRIATPQRGDCVARFD